MSLRSGRPKTSVYHWMGFRENVGIALCKSLRFLCANFSLQKWSLRHDTTPGRDASPYPGLHITGWWWTVWVCLVALTAIFCPALAVPVHASLSSTAVNAGVIVSVQCHPGTAFPDGHLVKFLQCVDNSSVNALSWNDTLAECQGRISLRKNVFADCVVDVVVKFIIVFCRSLIDGGLVERLHVCLDQQSCSTLSPGVPRRRPHSRQELATLPSVRANP